MFRELTLVITWLLILTLRAVLTSSLIDVPTQIRQLLVPSLFPNVPPYIKFPSENESTVILPDELGDHLKWQRPEDKWYLIEEIVTRAGFKVTANPNEALGTWLRHAPKIERQGSLVRRLLEPHQKIRNIRDTSLLGTKISLADTINRARNEFGTENFNFTPVSYVIPRQLEEFERAWDQTEDKLWIEKASAWSRGRGLRIITHPSEVMTHVPRVVQKYVTDTFTLEGAKSHLVMYAAVTSMSPLRLFMRDDLTLSVAIGKYSKDKSSLNDKCVHIPNFATFYKLNCNDGHIYPDRTNEQREALYVEFYDMLARNKMTKEDFVETVRDAIVKSFLISKYYRQQQVRRPSYYSSDYNGFDYFSIDFAIDNEGKVYILEFNRNPTLRVIYNDRRHEGLYKRKTQAITGALTLAGYQLPPTIGQKTKQLVASALNLTSTDVTINPALYNTQLSEEEKEKHGKFEPLVNYREQYLDAILKNLTPDDVRHLIVAEDELNRMRFYQRAYPRRGMNKYFQYIRNPYYDMLYDGFEEKYGENRAAGRDLLKKLAETNFHFK